MHELFGEPGQPVALHLRPIGEGIDALHGIGDALIERQEGFAQRGLADMANNAGGDVEIGLFAPG